MERSTRLVARGLALVLTLTGLAGPARAQTGDDVLFSTTKVAPNVLLLLDSSASMNHLIWHPNFVPGDPVSCDSATYGDYPTTATGAFDPDATYYGENNNFYYKDGVGNLIQDGSLTRTHCGKTRTIPADNNASPDPTLLGSNRKFTWYSGAYLNWLFSTQSDTYWGAGAPAGLRIDDNANGIPTSCVGGNAFAKYGRTRMNVTKQVLKDIVCQVNLVGDVRFGIAQFRNRANGVSDTNGGYVIEEVEVPTSNQQADLVSAINSVNADTDAPLAEAVFQLYTYYMSRNTAHLPTGKNGNPFPRYEYGVGSSGTGGNHTTSANGWAVDPVQYSCQKHFIMIITDGDSTQDHFAVVNDTDEAAGFADFAGLIGDHNVDAEAELEPNLAYPGSNSSLYLDDIALYMTETDFRPVDADFAGDQTIDTYTIGFHASDSSNQLLAKTAQVGNGLFFAVNDQDALAQAIIDQLQSIIEKAQSFTAATVPASRTADGEQLYVSLFTPTSKTPYWDGHLRSYRLDGAGRILDAGGLCAVDDPSGSCFSGSFLPVDQRPPFWDAADVMPAAASRNLYTTVLRGAALDPMVVPFTHVAPAAGVPPTTGVAAADLGVTFPPATTPAGSIATDAEEYTAEIVASVRGCEYGTGANGVPCVAREGPLADIFHSNPVVVGQPVLFESDPSYKIGFKTLVGGRDRIIYAGNNGGTLSGYHAGTWDSSANKYDAGTGVEQFGFMPWTSREAIQHKPFDKGNRDYYYVDGSPTVADVWMYTDWQTGTKNPAGTEWKTVLVTGSRQGGETYVALDVSDPSDCSSPPVGSYPCYLWEFPREDDATPAQDYIADTWGDPIVTKIRVTDGTDVFERWVAVVTGGYAEESDPNQHAAYDPTSLAGRGIAIVDMKTGELLAGRGFDGMGVCPGELYDPAAPERSMCFAISSTAGVYDTDGDGYADVIYVGDLGGNLWKWVIRAPLELSGPTTAVQPETDWPFRKIFQAPSYNDGTNDFYKSIYFPPAGTRKNGKIWLAFGTGERHDLLFTGDATTTADNNRFYVVEEIDLWEQAATPQDVVTEADLLDLSNTNACSDISGSRGYYIVGQEGEKWVTNVEIFVGFVIVNSYIPTPSADPCEIGGQAFLWAFKVECGEGLFTDGAGSPERALDIGAGLPTDPRVTVGSDGDVTNRLIISKQGGEIINLEAPPGFPGSGMFYWRELLD